MKSVFKAWEQRLNSSEVLYHFHIFLYNTGSSFDSLLILFHKTDVKIVGSDAYCFHFPLGLLVHRISQTIIYKQRTPLSQNAVVIEQMHDLVTIE